MKISEPIYRLLLKAYPARFRADYEASMAQHFRDQMQNAPGIFQTARLWLRTMSDLIQTVPARHLEYERGPVFVRMDQQARRTIFFAHYEAAFYSLPEITLEHLLLAAIRSDKALQKAMGGAAALELRCTGENSAHSIPAIAKQIPLSCECKQAINFAGEAGGGRVTTRHLVAGILQQENSPAAALLRQHNITSDY